MKSSIKALLMISLTGVVYIGTTLVLDQYHLSFAFYVADSIFFFLFTYALLYVFIFRRMEKLNKINKKIQKTLDTRQETIFSLTDRDLLTGLPNRFFFNAVLNKTISQAIRHNKILAILLIDLDGFQKIQTEYGHAISESVLKEMSIRFSHMLRSEDVLAKLEGDQFIVLLNDINKAKFASAVSEKLLSAASHLFTIESQTLSLTASIGICIFPHDGKTLDAMLNSANTALNNVKHNGGNGYQFYSSEIDTEAHEYIELSKELRQALNNHQFVLHYQPKLLLKTGTISGVETLLRWEHPKHGLVNPEKFISIAEDTGLIIQIGEWVLREACKMNKHWQKEGYEHITVSVNLSAKQFYHPDITEMIQKALQESGLDPSYLEIEITESTIMNNFHLTTEILEKIKKTGVRISMDHFGTGYISIRHLKNIPINSIKIDQSFIKGVPLIPNDIDITNAFIALAHSLRLEVVAEGVETLEQAQFLANQHCDVVQGYFLSHPVPAQKIVLQFKKIMDTIL